MAAQTSAETTPARVATDAWLRVVDARAFADSWKTAAAVFRATVTEEQWSRMVAAVREPLGAVVSRTEESSRATTTLPGAPDGEYVVSVFRTHFAQRAEARETVVAMQERDGQWRVAGYFVK